MATRQINFLLLLPPLLLVVALVQVDAATLLNSLSVHDNLRYNDNRNSSSSNVLSPSLQVSSVEREGNLDVIKFEGFDDNISLKICNLVTLLPLSNVDANDHRIPFTSVGSLEGVTALMLALSHLNDGDGSIVPEISQMKYFCPSLKFTTELFDTQLDERKAIDSVIKVVGRDDPTIQPLPCAFVGAYRSAVTMPTSIITGLQGYTQWAALSTSSDLDDSDRYPLAGRLNPSDDGTAVATILYLKQLGVNNLAIVHTNDAYGNAYVQGLTGAAAKHAPSMVIESTDLPFNLDQAGPGVLQQRVKKLKDTGFRYFFGIIFDAVHYDPLMTEAVKQGISGTGEHQWIFSDGVGVGRMVQRKYEPNSPLFQASLGAGMITAVGGLPSNDDTPYDRLASAMRQLGDNPDDMEYLKSKLPHYPEHPEYDAGSLVVEHPDFLNEVGLLAPFLYDAAVALGLAACNAIAAKNGGGGRQILTGEKHFQLTTEANFLGASGRVAIDPVTGTREATSAMFTLTNFVQDDDNNVGDKDNRIGIKAVVTNVFQNGDWTTLEPFIYNDGTFDIPADLPPSTIDRNHIATPARILILAFGFAPVLLSILFAVWTKIHSTDRVVKASQPIFLYIICLGSGLMGSSIILLGMDDKIMPEESCQINCIVFPWLFAMGFSLTAAALFTKTHRINMIINQKQFRRISVSALDVMKPMFFLVGVNAIALILWDVLDTAQWVRETTVYDNFGRPAQSIGYCSYEGALPYLVVLAITNVGAVLYACYEAYIARDVSTEFAESEYIFKSMAIVLLVFFVGIPVTIMTQENLTAQNSTIAGTICLVALSVLLHIFIPKYRINLKAVREDRKSELFRRDSPRFSSSEDYSNNNSSNNVADSDSGCENFGMRVFDRRILQSELEIENKRLKRRNKNLERRLANVRGGAVRGCGSGAGEVDDGQDSEEEERGGYDGRRNSRRSNSGGFDGSNKSLGSLTSLTGRTLKFVSDCESAIEMDPIDPKDESELEIAPF